jgi:hypothetical protein
LIARPEAGAQVDETQVWTVTTRHPPGAAGDSLMRAMRRSEGVPLRDDAGSTYAMNDVDFEGTLVLEQLAAIDKVEEFFDAVDADDVARATVLMRSARVDATTIAIVIEKMEQGDAEH